MIESMCGACVLVWPDTQTKLSPINTHARYNYWYDLASYTHENDKCPHLLDWTSKNTISDQTNILLYWWFCLRLFHVWFSLRRKTEMFFLHWLLKILVSNHCVYWLKLVFDLDSFNHRDFMIFFSKVSLFKKKRCFCGGFVLFANFHEHSIRYTTHSSHARCTAKKHTQTDLNCHSKPQIFTKDERKLY